MQEIVHNHLMVQVINEVEAIANQSPDFANKIVVEGELLVRISFRAVFKLNLEIMILKLNNSLKCNSDVLSIKCKVRNF